MNTILLTEKTIEEAIKKGLAEFNCSLKDVEVKILKHPGIFSKAEVEMTYTGENQIKTSAKSIMHNLEEKIVKDKKENAAANKPWQNQPNQSKKQPNQPGQGQQKSQQPQGNNQQKNQPNQQKQQGQTKQQNGQPGQPKNQPGQGQQKSQQPQGNNQQKNQPNQQNQQQMLKAQNDPRDIKLTPEQINAKKEKGAEYLEKVLQLMGIQSNLTISVSGDEVDINIGSNDSSIIGYHGETLDALEYLTFLAANPGDDKYVHFNLDAADYRNRRIESLIEMANKQADKAVKIHRAISLEPMNSATRRLIHSALTKRTDVSTKSDGKEPNRFIVIFPSKNQQGKQQGQKQQQDNRNNNQQKNHGQGKPEQIKEPHGAGAAPVKEETDS